MLYYYKYKKVHANWTQKTTRRHLNKSNNTHFIMYLHKFWCFILQMKHSSCLCLFFSTVYPWRNQLGSASLKTPSSCLTFSYSHFLLVASTSSCDLCPSLQSPLWAEAGRSRTPAGPDESPPTRESSGLRGKHVWHYWTELNLLFVTVLS